MFMPCGPCCCAISDDFNRANNSDIGSGWDVISGTWEINGNQLSGTGAGLVIWQTENPRGSGIQSASVRLDGLGGGEVIRLVVGSDATGDNYVAVEYKHASSDDGELSIVTRVAGVDTKETWEHWPTRPGEEATALFVCLRPAVGATPATLTAKLRRYGGPAKHRYWHRDITITPGLLGGLEIISGNVNFDDWTFGYAYDYFRIDITQEDPPCYDPEPEDCGNQDMDVSAHVPTIDILYGGSFANGEWTDGFLTLSSSVHNRGEMAYSIGVVAPNNTSPTSTTYIAFNAVDANNHYAVTASYTAGSPDSITLTIGRQAGGVFTSLNSQTFALTAAGDPSTFSVGVCVSDDEITASASNNSPSPTVKIHHSGLTPFTGGWYFGYVTLTPPDQFNISGVSAGSVYDDACDPCDHS